MAPPDKADAPGERTPLNTGQYGSNTVVYNNHNTDADATDDFTEVRSKRLIKTQNMSFWQDLAEFRPGSIPHSMILALSIGTVCGVAAFLYYAGLEFMLEFLWHTLPETYILNNANIPKSLHFLWIPLVGFTMAVGVGLTVRFLGEVRMFWLWSSSVSSMTSCISHQHNLEFCFAARRLALHNQMVRSLQCNFALAMFCCSLYLTQSLAP